MRANKRAENFRKNDNHSGIKEQRRRKLISH